MNLKDQIYTPSQQKIIRHVQVNLPFVMLAEEAWQDLLFALDLNPEIGLDAAALDRFSLSDFSRIADKIHDHGLSITIHGPFLDLSPGSPDPAIRDATCSRFQQMINAVAVFQPKSVVCHAAYDTYRYEFCRDEWYARSFDTWQWVADAVNARGARLMLENVYERYPEDLVDLLSPFDRDHVGCCLDVGHLSVFGRQPLSRWIESLAPWIGQLHLHDNNGNFDDHLPMGAGSIDFKPVLDFLAGKKLTPIITLEPHRQEDFRSSIRYLDRHNLLRRISPV
ncbi:MAG TPA: sugar phosphate isomerase/epimerase family protein [Desulfosalsimonadaceae bacterium]|nr:sugar phosphate isomerase/epimerase family protein [Desulfosalsimonadaceae bacterium]